MYQKLATMPTVLSSLFSKKIYLFSDENFLLINITKNILDESIKIYLPGKVIPSIIIGKNLYHPPNYESSTTSLPNYETGYFIL